MCQMCGCECGWSGYEGGHEHTGPWRGIELARRRASGWSWGSPRYVGRSAQLRWLEERQRDLEQEAADVADAIGRLRQEAGEP